MSAPGKSKSSRDPETVPGADQFHFLRIDERDGMMNVAGIRISAQSSLNLTFR
jgi:hypothetical protein